MVLMLPGSGPSTRDNDTYFPPIRDRLLEHGYAVASFDKRGVGASTGALIDTGIEQQADDAARCIEALRAHLPGAGVAVFGHSQGGWAAFEVAAWDPTLVAAVANSGPVVGVAEQERFRLVGTVDRAVRSDEHRHFESLVRVATDGGSHHDALAAVSASAVLREELDGAEMWPLVASILRYEPTTAIQAIAIPTLCIYGSRDRVVPVTSCVIEVERVANPNVDVAVVPGGDHRMQLGPSDFAPGYLEMLTTFLSNSLGTT